MSLSNRLRTTTAPVFPFELRWFGETPTTAAPTRLLTVQPWHATAHLAANTDAARARRPARLHRYSPASAPALFRIR